MFETISTIFFQPVILDAAQGVRNRVVVAAEVERGQIRLRVSPQIGSRKFRPEIRKRKFVVVAAKVQETRPRDHQEQEHLRRETANSG